MGLSGRGYRDLPLSVVRRAFEDRAGRGIGRELERVVSEGVGSWGQLRDWLVDPRLPMARVDGVWVRLVRRARVGGSEMGVVCAGLALPMLDAAGFRLGCGGGYRDRADIESGLLTGFFGGLQQVDLGRGFVLHRLRWEAFRSGYRVVCRQRSAPVPVEQLTIPGMVERQRGYRQLMRPQEGSPELVLADAVAAGVISQKAAELISATRLQAETLTAFAARHGVSYKSAQQIRRRAEHKLATWIVNRARDDSPLPDSSASSHTPTSPTGFGVLPRGCRGGVRNQFSGRVLNCGAKTGVVKGGRPSAGPRTRFLWK